MTTRKSSSPTVTRRRDFLKLATLGVAGSAAVAIAGKPAAAAELAKSSSGYAETAHVRTYYNSCRF